MDADKLEFERFFHGAYAVMVAYCKARGLSDADADEIADEAFVRMWRAWDKCAGFDDARRKKWLYNAINYIIREREKSGGPPPQNIDDYIETLGDETGGELAQLFEKYDYDVYVERAKKILSPAERELFVRVVSDGMSYREAADSIGKSVDNVYVMMTNIRAKISKSKKKIFR